MPKGTPVARMKEAMMREHPEMPVGSAIAIAQKKSGLSYATGKKPKSRLAKAAQVLKKRKKVPNAAP